MAGALGDASAGRAARYGWALFYAFHHVGLAFRSPNLRLPADAEQVLAWAGVYAVDAVAAFALLSGTALAARMLTRAGQGIGETVGGPELRRGNPRSQGRRPLRRPHLDRLVGPDPSPSLPDAAPLSVHPSHLAAFFWPLGIGVAFGAIGGIRAAGEAV
ncbi:MAG TPA: hypothetical protein VK977_10425 [Actinomycetota bacterium]|nr:hypothetical protein [Actinomycetota bacterium]